MSDLRGSTQLLPFDQIIQELAQGSASGVFVLRTHPPIELVLVNGEVAAARFDRLGEIDAFAEAVHAPPSEYSFEAMSPEEARARVEAMPEWARINPPAHPALLLLEASTKTSTGELALPRMRRALDALEEEAEAIAIYRGMNQEYAQPARIPEKIERQMRAIRRIFAGSAARAVQIRVGARAFALVPRGSHTLVAALPPGKALSRERLAELARS